MARKPPVTPPIDLPRHELHFTFSRSSGPGGQNVNKLNTKATLRWAAEASPSLPGPVRERFLAMYRSKLTRAGELIITSQRFRDAGRNADDCLKKLAKMLAAAARPPTPRRPTRATAGSVARRLEHKRAHARRKKERRRQPAERED